jgi:tetratricopeptide (TPR) repeat protein
MPAPQSSAAPAQPSSDLTGSTIGRYAVRSRLGAGGHGEVYSAYDLQLNRTVALKRLSPLLRLDERYRQRFLREAQRASGLNDAHIAGIYDVLEHQGELLLVMQYVEGESLRQRLRRPLPLEDFLPVAMQSCEALIAAHESGVVHRDIKPENIMLTRTGRVKVLDFGVAKRLPSEQGGAALQSTETVTGDLSGTPAYMAPEMLLGQQSDARADIFSLGVVFYEALTSKHPFLADGLVATVDRILHAEPEGIAKQHASLPSALEQIVTRMLAKNPDQRYRNARDLLADLRALAPLPVSRENAVLRLLRKHRRASIAAAVILVMVVAAINRTRDRETKVPIFAERDWVLIADPENATGQKVFDDSLREALTIALQQSQYVNVLPRARVFEALDRMKRSGTKRVDENLGRDLAQRENVRVLLASSIRLSGETLQITVRGLEPQSGDLLFAENEQLQDQDDFFDRVDSLAKRVRNNLGEATTTVQARSRSLEKVTTRSLEALQLYSQAADAMVKGNMNQVPALLEGALALDPDFAMAHARLGQYYSWIVGKNERAIKELQRAYDLRHGLTDREQRWIEQSYYNSQERYDQAAQSLKVLVSLYPDDAQARQELAAAYYNLGQLDGAISELRSALTLNPYSVPSAANLILYLARNSQEGEAILAFQSAKQRGLDSPAMHWALGLAYLGQHRLSEARAEFRSLSQDQNFRTLGERGLAWTTLYEGRISAGVAELQTALATAGRSPTGAHTVTRYLLGRTFQSLGKLAQARNQAKMILASPESELQTFDLLLGGFLYAGVGETDLAKKVLRRLDETRKAHPSSWNESCFYLLSGEIALAEENPARSIAFFESAGKEYPQFFSRLGLARAFRAQQNWQESARYWQEVLNVRGQILLNGYPPDLALANLELARALRNLKKPEAARIYYELFLQRWKYADRLSIRQEAETELASLPKSMFQTLSD